MNKTINKPLSILEENYHIKQIIKELESISQKQIDMINISNQISVTRQIRVSTALRWRIATHDRGDMDFGRGILFNSRT